jgi:hypothetical protein
MTPDQKLAAFLTSDPPPPRDYAFEAEVARRIAMRRAWLAGLTLVPWMGITGILLWGLDTALAPHIGGFAHAALPLAMALTLACGGAMGVLWLSRGVAVT